MKEKLAVWISQRRGIPYRFRKSFIKRTCPKILSDYPFEINFYGMKYTGNTSDNTDRMFFLFGGCEKYMLAFMRDYCGAAKSKDFIFLDIGAHVGNHSLFMSKHASHVHAFEPNPRVRESLNSKVYLNKLKNVTVHPIGLADRNERIPFYMSTKDDSSFGSFRDDHDARNDNSIDLDVRIGDEVMRDSAVEKVDLIKIDVEGFEREAIEGLKNTIEGSRPLIILEVSNTTRKTFGSRDDFESVFPKDYTFYQFTNVNRERESYKLQKFNYNEERGNIEVVAVPREKRVYINRLEK